MKVGDLIIMKDVHTTGCGKDYPVNSIGTLVSSVPDCDGELRIRFAQHISGNDYSYIPVCKVSMVQKTEIDRARKMFDKCVESCLNAVL